LAHKGGIVTRKKQCYWYPVCPIKHFVEEGRLDHNWIEKYCLGDNSKCVRKMMEDKGQYHPDNMLPDGSIDNNLFLT